MMSFSAILLLLVMTGSNMEAPSKARELFTEAVRAVLDNWPVLQIAVDNGFGGVYGQQKADWLVDVIQKYFHDNADLQQEEVEDFLSAMMDQEFDTVVDDGSLPQVSVSLCQLFADYKRGALDVVRQTLDKLTAKKNICGRAKVTAQKEESSSDEEPELMECEAPPTSSVSSTTETGSCPPPPPTQEEDDGWTVVRKKK